MMVQVIDPILGSPWFVKERPYRDNKKERVDPTPLRVELERQMAKGDMTLSEIALRLDWIKSGNDPRPDATRVRRCLQRRSIGYHNAVRICQALEMAPHEAGL